MTWGESEAGIIKSVQGGELEINQGQAYIACPGTGCTSMEGGFVLNFEDIIWQTRGMC